MASGLKREVVEVTVKKVQGRTGWEGWRCRCRRLLGSMPLWMGVKEWRERWREWRRCEKGEKGMRRHEKREERKRWWGWGDEECWRRRKEGWRSEGYKKKARKVEEKESMKVKEIMLTRTGNELRKTKWKVESTNNKWNGMKVCCHGSLLCVASRVCCDLGAHIAHTHTVKRVLASFNCYTPCFKSTCPHCYLGYVQAQGEADQATRPQINRLTRYGPAAFTGSSSLNWPTRYPRRASALGSKKRKEYYSRCSHSASWFSEGQETVCVWGTHKAAVPEDNRRNQHFDVPFIHTPFYIQLGCFSSLSKQRGKRMQCPELTGELLACGM